MNIPTTRTGLIRWFNNRAQKAGYLRNEAGALIREMLRATELAGDDAAESVARHLDARAAAYSNSSAHVEHAHRGCPYSAAECADMYAVTEAIECGVPEVA